MAASDHTETTVSELGYRTQRCSADGLPWPCPTRGAQIAAANDPDYDPDDWPTAEDPPEAYPTPLDPLPPETGKG